MKSHQIGIGLIVWSLTNGLLASPVLAQQRSFSEPNLPQRAFTGPVQALETNDLSQLRAKLRHAQAEIERLRNGDPLRQASWLQNGAAGPSGGTNAPGGAGGGSGGLAAKSQNPVSDLVSLPFQSNFDLGTDPGNRTRFVGNLQPVVPIKLNDDWNLINRVILPFVNAPFGPDDRFHGIGDTLGQFFFSPRDSGEIIWGIGPNVLFPTASRPTLGFQEWGAGANGVGAVQVFGFK